MQSITVESGEGTNGHGRLTEGTSPDHKRRSERVYGPLWLLLVASSCTSLSLYPSSPV